MPKFLDTTDNSIDQMNDSYGAKDMFMHTQLEQGIDDDSFDQNNYSMLERVIDGQTFKMRATGSSIGRSSDNMSNSMKASFINPFIKNRMVGLKINC